MKKLLTVTAVLLLALTLLWGCKENPDTQADIPLFYNLDRGASLTADEAGSYSVRFAQGAQIETYKVTDEALLTKILKQDFLGLILEGDTVTGMVSMWDMPYQRLARDYSVQSIGGKLVKLNSSISNAGDEIMLELSEDVPVYDFSSLSTTPGTTTALQKNDRASVIADENGNVKFVYVTYRAATLGTEKILCQHCESNVYWYDWFSDTDLPTTDGHYILKYDVNMVTTAKIGSGDICLDLNGKTVTQTSYGKQIYMMRNSGTLSIMDSVGGGKFIPASTDTESPEPMKWGMIIDTEAYECTVNLYGGTLDASNCTAQYGCAINQTAGTLNMYGGEILGGTAYGTGSTAIRVGGTFNMYGGKIVGGKHINIGYDSINIEGGAVIRAEGIVTIYDGIIEGGESWTDGGILYLGKTARLVMKGGTITSGRSATRGGGIFATDATTITLSGNAKITGNEGSNLWIDGFAKVYIGDEGLGADAKIGITMEEPGTFITDVPDGVDISKYFISDDASKKIVKTGDGWTIK